MEEIVRQEIETLRAMVLNWKRSYLGYASPEGGDEFLATEFSEELTTHVYPYVRRLYQCSHITQEEASEFMEFCSFQVDELRASLRAPEKKRKTAAIWTRLVKAVK